MPTTQMAMAARDMAIFFPGFLAPVVLFGVFFAGTIGFALTRTTVPGARVRPQEGQESGFLTTAVADVISSKNFLSLEKCLPQPLQHRSTMPGKTARMSNSPVASETRLHGFPQHSQLSLYLFVILPQLTHWTSRLSAAGLPEDCVLSWAGVGMIVKYVRAKASAWH